MQDDELIDPLRLLWIMEAHYEAGNGRKAINDVISAIDDWCDHERFDLCDELLKNASPSKIGTTLTVAILGVTSAAHDLGKLKEREGFMVLAEEYMYQKNPDTVHMLLDRFK